MQSIVSPVISTSLYFVVFGAAIGSRITAGRGRHLRRLHRARPDHADGAHRRASPTRPSASTSRNSPGTIYELLSAPVSYLEIVRLLCRRGGHQVDHARPDHPGDGATSSCRCTIEHPFWMVLFLVLTAVTFSLFGFIIGIWADGFEKLQLIPLLIVTPLTFLGGSFYSIDMLPPVWRTVSLFNPVVYLVSGFRWSFFGTADVGVEVSLGMTLVFLSPAWRRRLDIPDRLPAEELAVGAPLPAPAACQPNSCAGAATWLMEAAHCAPARRGIFVANVHGRPAGRTAQLTEARLPSHGAHRDEIRRDVRRRHQPHPQRRAPRQTRGRCRPRGRGRGLGHGRQDQRAGRLDARDLAAARCARI